MKLELTEEEIYIIIGALSFLNKAEDIKKNCPFRILKDKISKQFVENLKREGKK